jgi:hypothetical protein
MGEGRSDEELIAMGRKPQDYDEHAFQGIHARYVLVILDEACGIPKPLWDAVATIVTNDNSRVLAIGNPDDPSSEFAMKCRPASDYNVITIPAFDTPNFTGEAVSDLMKEVLVSPGWVEERRREWGEGSNLWTSKVLAEFPDVSDEYLISPSMIARAHVLDLPGLTAGRYGMDVSRFGEDKTVIYRNRGGQIRLVDSWAKMDTMTSAGRAAMFLRRHHPVVIPMMIDVVGLGAGVYDRLREQNLEVGGFEGSTRAINPTKFQNRRAESWWTFRTLLENGLLDLDPDDDRLANELMSVKWTVDSAGRIKIETKEDMRERGVASPNHADACILSTVDMGTIIEFSKHASLANDLLSREM